MLKLRAAAKIGPRQTGAAPGAFSGSFAAAVNMEGLTADMPQPFNSWCKTWNNAGSIKAPAGVPLKTLYSLLGCFEQQNGCVAQGGDLKVQADRDSAEGGFGLVEL